MVTQSRKTISKNPLDEIPAPGKRAEKAARPIKKSAVIDHEVLVPKKSPAASKTKKIAFPERSVEKAKREPRPLKATRAKSSVAQSKATTQTVEVAQDIKFRRTEHESAEQLMAAELARSSVPIPNRDDEIISDPCTHTKVLEQPGGLSSPTGAFALSGQFLTAEDIFQNELSRARVAVKAELTRTRLSAQKIVGYWSRWSVAVSFIPTPFVDMAAISSVQIKMIYELCKQYEVDFEHKAAVAIVSGVAGGAAVKTLGGLLAKQMVRFAPGVGPVFMFAVEPAISYVTTQAMGSAFISHFEADGRMHDFNPEKIRQYMAAQIEKRKLRFKDKSTLG
jgi:uncharacterized protein (DUF697 family)